MEGIRKTTHSRQGGTLMNREEFIKKRVKEHYQYLTENYDYEIVYLALQGSQNYGLDVYDKDYKSDVDTKAIVLPSFEDFVYNRKPVSETIVLPNNEHIDVKDIRIMFDTFKKQNINFIEILFSKYSITNPKYEDEINYLIENAELIAHFNYNQALKCMAGMSKEKLKALQHPYPTIIDKIEKFGYDPKQLHHILRMNDFIKKYVSGKSYKECLIPDNKDYLIKIKKGILPCCEAVRLANQVDTDTYTIKVENLLEEKKVNSFVIEVLDKVKYDCMYKKFKEDILGRGK